MTTPRAMGFVQPAEWEPHTACWLAWPYIEDWGPSLAPARSELVALARAIADVDPATSTPRGEALRVVVADPAHEREARDALGDVPAKFVPLLFGDIWTRDIAPVFVRDSAGVVAASTFRFNGWGEKYRFAGDAELAVRIAETLGMRWFASDLVAEGGAFDVDGAGTVLTTRSCLLSEKRNPGRTEAAVETAVRDALGAEVVLWLDDGLANDHTDGHVDTIARFVAPGVVVCMEPSGADDPNRTVLEAIARDLASFRDARAKKLDVVRIPSPGRIVDENGKVVPASYANFYVANTTVVVPTYGARPDEDAVDRIAALFPDRTTVGLSARAILSGGGAFHCITQQEPHTGAR